MYEFYEPNGDLMSYVWVLHEFNESNETNNYKELHSGKVVFLQ